MEHFSKKYEISNLDLESKSPNVKNYLIVWNSLLNKELSHHLISLADVLVCGDGGANQLYKILSEDER
jgi:hypothetical protein